MPVEPTNGDAARYLKQVIVVRKDLSMPAGKLAAMVAHAAMTFIVKRIKDGPEHPWIPGGAFTADEWQWMTEFDPGLEHYGQVSFAKIVCAVDTEAELEEVDVQARSAGLQVWPVIDSGHSHNKPDTFVAIAIGPAWPEQLEPITGHLKVYR